MISQGAHILFYGALLVTLLPLVWRLALSPITLVILGPFLMVLGLLSFVFSSLIFALFVEWLRPQNPAPNAIKSATRTLSFATPAAWQANLTKIQWLSQDNLPPIKECSPDTSELVHEIIDLIIRDFVQVWYSNLSNSPAFPNALRRTIQETLENILARGSQLDVSALVVRKILPKITAHIEKFRQSEESLRGAALERRLSVDSEELDILLAIRYVGRGKLHRAVANLSSMATRPTEDLYLRQIFDQVLPLVLPEADAKSRSVVVVAREIVGCSVLRPVIDMLSDPDFWNQAIDKIASAAIREQKLVTKVRHMLEKQVPKSGPSRRTSPSVPGALSAPRGSKSENINWRTDAKRFEMFLQSIKKCESLLDARRLKNDIMNEIRRTRDLLAQHASDDWIDGVKTETIVSYLDRLYNAKNEAEKRIEVLSGAKTNEPQTPSTQTLALPNKLVLRDILRDSSSLLYFMEFMERRNHRTLLVQFWLAADAFKDPLAQIDSDSDASDDEGTAPRNPATTATLIEDTTMLYEVYFAQPQRAAELSCVSPKYIATLTAFVQSEFPPTRMDENRVRRCVLHAQNQVEKAMEEDFEVFTKSELWHRAVGDMSPRVEKPLPSTLILDEPEMQAATPISRAPASSDSPTLIHASHSVPIVRRPMKQRPSSLISNDSNRQLSSFDILMGSTEDMDGSRTPLFEDMAIERKKIDALQAALTDIIADDTATRDYKPSLSPTKPPSTTRETQTTIRSSKVFPEEDSEPLLEPPERADEVIPPLQVALPGDLQLARDVARLSEKIKNLQTQETMLEALMRKAELTGEEQELSLLSRSRDSLVREIRGLTFQRAHYEVQEAANRLVPERTKITIVDTATSEEDGRTVVRYLIEIQQLALDGGFASGWGVARRYSEFYDMHTRLKERFAEVRSLEFPGKKFVTALSNNMVDARRTGLEKYLQKLILVPSVCDSDELRAFLSRQATPPALTPTVPADQGLVRTMYRSVADSIDDMFFGPSMLDVTLQRLSRRAAELTGMYSQLQDEDAIARVLGLKSRPEEALGKLQGDLMPLDGETGASSFSAPICDLLLAMFELDRKDNWLRRQAMVTILQQLLGSTIERKVRDTVRTSLAESQILGYITTFRNTLWPEGKLKPASVPRTDQEKVQTREQAHSKLSAIMPDLAANMIGRSNARRGARRMFAVMQNRRLNQHIIYTIIDEFVEALFPEVQISA
ncbi:Sorting nexin-12 OS=Schizosaccharomyces pombe (strain 972 / ATCC 24843) GN=snx12 PE=3 SV=1 [Rhizoctonia solani AG-1 IB]|uniref:Sorting nexin-12 n=1 Tax=Thanatephorus cucumeris (strain AG1-IB / isolate 7/3/14) TaxID=1108050 RepID=A0A0B7FFI5_THACB|nr:Sorting nexin-12 OS=Schizosaccharomyces pombe (strain 972 / ATCC 24843) GN=snx12 PE=3 SV=1 [Rhizoctonia solani AG-1 IB]